MFWRSKSFVTVEHEYPMNPIIFLWPNIEFDAHNCGFFELVMDGLSRFRINLMKMLVMHCFYTWKTVSWNCFLMMKAINRSIIQKVSQLLPSPIRGKIVFVLCIWRMHMHSNFGSAGQPCKNRASRRVRSGRRPKGNDAFSEDELDVAIASTLFSAISILLMVSIKRLYSFSSSIWSKTSRVWWDFLFGGILG